MCQHFLSISLTILSGKYFKIMILNYLTDRSGQTVQILITLQSNLNLNHLLFHLRLLRNQTTVEPLHSKFRMILMISQNKPFSDEILKMVYELSCGMRKPMFWFQTWSNTNQAVQLQKMARGLKFWIKEIEGLYYLCSENKGADQLRGYREADLRLCFRICKMLVFS